MVIVSKCVTIKKIEEHKAKVWRISALLISEKNIEMCRITGKTQSLLEFVCINFILSVYTSIFIKDASLIY